MQDKLRARSRIRIEHSFEHEGKQLGAIYGAGAGAGTGTAALSSDTFKARSGITPCDLGVADVEM